MDHQKVSSMVQQLPDWFNKEARRNIKIDLEFHQGFIAEDTAGEAIGFLTFYVYEAVGVIGWLGVLSDKHRTGVGTELLTAFEDEMKKNGIHLIQVYTLSDSVDYPPYEGTRKFYFKNKFIEYRRVQTTNPECPEELYLRKKLDQRSGI